ncbi:hypothetical protein EDD16DRAFT_1180057 [Pisolithus croceorrhizus]|nr:hypothetical protein EDD16DRAFT_1180057 [Pisolithus croceorrhizus]
MVCRRSSLLISGEIVVAILQRIGTVTMIVRVYVLYNKDRRIPILLVVVAAVGAGMCCVNKTVQITYRSLPSNTKCALLLRPPPPTPEEFAASTLSVLIR